ncbi:hypothetical protein MMC26_007787 [Xylographa opegraphella]|nr:hypothetical protein [Xylographa opegraphella]
MNSQLINRSLGATITQAFQQAETTRLLQALQLAPNIQYDSSNENGEDVKSHAREAADGAESRVWAHPAGVNCLEIDRFESRYLLSGGADSSIHIWDLDTAENNTQSSVYHPLGTVPKSYSSHKFGVTELSFYPFDSFAFLSSSYDHFLKLYSTKSLEVSASFDLSSVVYAHAISPVADHLLVACATQHPAVRLVDLRSGASAHSLAGHCGAVLSVAWSPHDANILATAGSDGTARLWDIRSSTGHLGLLDLEDSLGTIGDTTMKRISRPMDRRKAHAGACNGVAWTDDGDYLVTTGHDERIRTWSATTGANTLSHFGPTIKNANLSTVLPLLAPSYLTSSRQQVMFYPNDNEILMFDLFEGTLHKRLKAPGNAVGQARGGTGQRNLRNRVASLAWRSGHVELYSAHSDGVIRIWIPGTKEDAELEGEGPEEAAGVINEDNNRKRKREALNDLHRDLTRQRLTFN